MSEQTEFRPADGENVITLDTLASRPRWVAWVNEPNAKKPDDMRKVPRNPRTGRLAMANEPDTWGTREAAEECAAQIVNGTGGGIGLQFGEELGAGLSLGGIDLDTCREIDGTFTPWALAVMTLVPSYTEISPSQTGAKIFFCYPTQALPDFRKHMSQTSKWSKTFKRKSDNGHAPAIEVHLGTRYFTVTEQHLPETPTDLRLISPDTIVDLLTRVGPDFVGQGGAQKSGDNSRSGAAYRLAVAFHRESKSFEDYREALYTNPQTTTWAQEQTDERQFTRAWDKAGKAVTQEDGYTLDDSLPTVTVVQGQRHRAADAGLDAMFQADVSFFVRGRKLVRTCFIPAKSLSGELVQVPSIVPVETVILGRVMGQTANWQEKRKKGCVSVDPPKEVVEQAVKMVGEWPFHPLTGVINTPTLRADGSLLSKEGYDLDTGYMLLSPPPMPDIPDTPTKDDATAALALLTDLLDEFPFAGEPSLSVGISMLMTPVLRPGLFPAVPLHLVTAPESGTGKSYLVEITSAIATGDRCYALNVEVGPEEVEKRLISSALAGHPIISLDNCNGGKGLASSFLAQIVSQPGLFLRKLGGSEDFRIPNTSTVFGNGNNMVVRADVVRRTIMATLDANMAKPSERVFQHKPVEMVLADRGRYIAAVLTIARAYIVAGRPEKLDPLHGFEGWSDTVRSALVWLGMADPIATQKDLEIEDPARVEIAAVFDAWATEIADAHNESGFLLADLIKAAQETAGETRKLCRPELLAAFETVARAKDGNGVNPKALGWWFKQSENRVSENYKLGANRRDQKRVKWVLKKLQNAPSRDERVEEIIPF